MTLEQFLDELKTTTRKWIGERNIRLYHEPDKNLWSRCPITAVYEAHTGRNRPCSEWSSCAFFLDLDQELAKQIVDAADANEGFNFALRDKLLEACGVKQ